MTTRDLIIPIRSFIITLQAIEDGLLSGFLGSELHGAFGLALWEHGCKNIGKANFDCKNMCDCNYGKIFAPPSPINVPVKGRFDDPAKPYVFDVSLLSKTNVKRGDLLKFGFNLFGNKEINKREIEAIFVKLGQCGIGPQKIRFELKAFVERKINKFNSQNNFKNNTLIIEYLTPTLIKDKNLMVNTIPFNLLIRKIMERSRDLAYLYNEKPYYDDNTIRPIYESLTSIQIEEQHLYFRNFQRGERKSTLYGWTGKIIYKGNFSDWMGILQQGELLHVGNYTTFGLGQYQIVHE